MKDLLLGKKPQVEILTSACLAPSRTHKAKYFGTFRRFAVTEDGQRRFFSCGIGLEILQSGKEGGPRKEG